MFYLTVFCVLEFLQRVIGGVLSCLNYVWQQDAKRLDQTKQVLKLSSEDLTKAQQYSKDQFWFGLVKLVVGTVLFFAFLLGGGFVYVESLAAAVATQLGESSSHGVSKAACFL